MHPYLDVVFESNYKATVEKQDLKNILLLQEQCKEDRAHKALISQVVQSYKDVVFNHVDGMDLGMEYRVILLELFTIYNHKKSIRKYLVDKLTTTQEDGKKLFEVLILQVMTEILDNIGKNNVCFPKQCMQFLNIVNLHVQTFKEDVQYSFIIENVFSFYLSIFSSVVNLFSKNENFCLPKNEDVSTILDESLKQALETMTKYKNNMLINYGLEFVVLSYEVIKYDKIKYEMRAKAALLLAHSLNYLPEEEAVFITHKSYPILDILENFDKQYCLVLKSKQFENIFVDDVHQIILYYAVFNATDNVELKFKGQPLLVFLTKNLTDSAIRTIGMPPQIIITTRTLSMISEYLNKLPNDSFEKLLSDCLYFTWTNLEHFVESVRHYVKAFFTKIIQHCSSQYRKGNTSFLNTIIKEIKLMSHLNTVRLISLSILCENVDCKIILENFADIQNYLLKAMTDLNTASEALKIYNYLMEKDINQHSEADFINKWIDPVLKILRGGTCTHIIFKDIVVRAFQLNPQIFPYLYPSNYIGTKSEWIIQLRCIHYARLKEINVPVEPDNHPNLYWRDLFLKNKLELFMIHQDEDVRLSALQTVVESQKTTEELTDWELSFLLCFYIYNASNQNTSTRNKISSLYKRLFARYQASCNHINRQIANTQEISTDKIATSVKHLNRTSMLYRFFLNNFINLLIKNIGPNANYPRRSLALELLLILSTITEEEQWIVNFKKYDVDNLKNILFDNYDSNKMMAVSLLKTLPPDLLGFKDVSTTQQFFDECIKCALLTSPIKCLSSAFMLQVCLHSSFPLKDGEKDNRLTMLIFLLELLEEMFAKNQKDIIEAATNRPMHGVVHCIKSLLGTCTGNEENYKLVFKKVLELCFLIKTHIMPIVCNPSPEGHIPDNDYVVDETSTAQKVLMYSWRTMKEIMHLVAEIVKQTIPREFNTQMLPESDLIEVGECFVDIFLQTKHRGVFEQAYVAFSVVCHQFWRSNNDKINTLPSKWLNDVIRICKGETVDGRLCATRRSAGLPFLVLSIITTESPLGKNCFHKIMNELLAVANASEERNELKMHALNILRFIVQNSKLSDFIVNYLSSAFITSFKGFESRTWGVRNSSTLLFAALITRMFGVQRTPNSEDLPLKNRMTVTNFCLRYKGLFEFLLDSLVVECRKKESLTLYPMLLLLVRLYPSHSYQSTDVLEKYIKHIEICLSNPIYRIREAAAQASVSLMPCHKIPEQLSRNFEKLSYKNLKDSDCNGVLLQVRHLLKTYKNVPDLPVTDYLTKSFHILNTNKYSHMTVNLYLEITVLLLKLNVDLATLKELLHLVTTLDVDNELNISKSKIKWTRIEVILLIINKCQHVDDYSEKTMCDIIKYLYHGDLNIKTNCLLFFVELNEAKLSINKYHPLLISEDIGIPENIRNLVQDIDLQCRERILNDVNPVIERFLIHCLTEEKAEVLVFLLLRYYPAIIEEIRNNPQERFDFLLNFCNSDDEEIICAVICYIQTYFSRMDEKLFKEINFGKFLDILMECACPASADFRRLSAAQLLVTLPGVFYEGTVLKAAQLYNIFNIVMVLFEDDEMIIRNTISTLKLTKNPFNCVPDKARADFLKQCVKLLPKELGICFLFGWSLRYLPIEQIGPELYKPPKFNQYAENVPIIYSASKILNNILWTEAEGFHGDKLKIIKQITNTLLESLTKNEIPIMSSSAKRISISLLEKLMSFVETYREETDIQDNFGHDFKGILESCIGSPDYCSLKYLFNEIYDQVSR